MKLTMAYLQLGPPRFFFYPTTAEILFDLFRYSPFYFPEFEKREFWVFSKRFIHCFTDSKWTLDPKNLVLVHERYLQGRACFSVQLPIDCFFKFSQKYANLIVHS